MYPTVNSALKKEGKTSSQQRYMESVSNTLGVATTPSGSRSSKNKTLGAKKKSFHVNRITEIKGEALTKVKKLGLGIGGWGLEGKARA